MRMIEPITETITEPIQPRRFEKKANMKLNRPALAVWFVKPSIFPRATDPLI